MRFSLETTAALLYGPSPHHIDHLAPLCAFMRIPLIVTEEEIASSCRKYYPGLSVIFLNYLELPEKLISSFDLLFYSIPRALFDEVFFFAQRMLRKKVATIWCPHGNSDKGASSYFMEALHEEKIALLYGKKMTDFLIKKHVFEQLQTYVLTGNFRYSYYKMHKTFYDSLVSQEILRRLPTASKTILFAPTWQDREGSSSFFDACPLLIENLPEGDNLIIKLHPNLLLQPDSKTEKILWTYENRPNVLFLADFPPIYPLLNAIDIYIGDMSSIGYDALSFNKPLFFLNQTERDPQTDEGLYLYRCGIAIAKEHYKEIYQIIDKHLPEDAKRFSKIRKEVYEYTFGKEEKPLEALRSEIISAYNALPEDDLTFL